MLILRSKKFSVPKPGEMIQEQKPQQVGLGEREVPEPGQQQRDRENTSLEAEQMKSQRMALQIQHQKEQLKIKEDMARQSQITQIRKMKAEKEEDQRDNQIKIRKLEVNNGKADNTSLYKSKAKVVDPVPMKS